MQMSAEIGALAGALAKAQGAMQAARKDRENPFFKSTYATLSSVIDAIREPFAANGLSFSQPPRIDETTGRVIVTTVIMHASGQWISGEATATPAKNDVQGLGSVITYLKRYQLQAMVGISSAEEDDDGNAAAQKAYYSGVNAGHKALAKGVFIKLGIQDEAVMKKCSAWLDAEQVSLADVDRAAKHWAEITKFGSIPYDESLR